MKWRLISSLARSIVFNDAHSMKLCNWNAVKNSCAITRLRDPIQQLERLIRDIIFSNNPIEIK